MRKCFLDIDGIIADMLTGCMAHHGFANPYDDPSKHGLWDFADHVGLEPKAFWDPLGEDFWANLPLTDDAYAIVSMVEKRFGNQVCLLSSPCRTPGCHDGKVRWVERHFPQFDRKRRLFGSAKEFCASIDALLIDDWDQNVNAFRCEGGFAFLYPRIWNSRYTERERALELLEEYLFS